MIYLVGLQNSETKQEEIITSDNADVGKSTELKTTYIEATGILKPTNICNLVKTKLLSSNKLNVKGNNGNLKMRETYKRQKIKRKHYSICMQL
jgi:hypothetical protein